MMKKLFTLLIIALTGIHYWAFGVSAQTGSSQFITITVPQKVIQDSLTRILPITLPGTSDKLEGTITIVNITNFKIYEKRITGNVDLKGENLNLVTSVANQNIRLKLGTARVDFDCIADLRYDANQKVLYIRPIAEGIDGEEALKKGDIGQALMLLFNDREIPLDMKNLKPFIAETGNKLLTVQTDIADIRTSPAALHLKLIPVITALPKQQSKTEKQ